MQAGFPVPGAFETQQRNPGHKAAGVDDFGCVETTARPGAQELSKKRLGRGCASRRSGSDSPGAQAQQWL
ncbi:hypothetical protein D7X33_10085 [Butyricicoccus sp. 1XD8-22]|nr:hypothetical protein D7X33_10085 [Butyricicoccus sp. 1XD8-22]